MVKIGVTDSFSTELWSLREGLQLVKEGGFERVVVEMDSESTIKIMRRDRECEEGANMLIWDCLQLTE